MATQVSWDMIGRFVSPHIQTFTSCSAPDLQPQFENANRWVSNLFAGNVLRALFGQAPNDEAKRQQVANVVRRCSIAFSEYHVARSATIRFIELGRDSTDAVSAYNRAVGHWESSILNLSICTDLRELVQPCQPEATLRQMANSIKHWGERIQEGAAQVGDTWPLWLTNDGFETRHRNGTTMRVAYSAIARILRESAAYSEGVLQ